MEDTLAIREPREIRLAGVASCSLIVNRHLFYYPAKRIAIRLVNLAVPCAHGLVSEGFKDDTLREDVFCSICDP